MYPLARYVTSTKKLIRVSVADARIRSLSSLVSRTSFRSLLDRTCSQHSKASMSLCRQNYPEECEAGVNRQINMELYASYVYSSMVSTEKIMQF